MRNEIARDAAGGSIDCAERAFAVRFDAGAGMAEATDWVAAFDPSPRRPPDVPHRQRLAARPQPIGTQPHAAPP